MSDLSKYKKIKKEDYLNIAGPDWPSFEKFQSLNDVPEFIREELSSMMTDITPEYVFSNNTKDYLDFLDQKFFYVCQEKSVLEIGPNAGIHTAVIQKNRPSYQEAIEPDMDVCQTFRKKYPDVNLVSDDVYQVLATERKFDVVICFGVLYHLHSPLYLLELIVNSCDPEYILLDCVNSPKELIFREEIMNIPGNRFSLGNRKSCKFNLVAPFEIITQSMRHMDYRLIDAARLSLNDYDSKNNSWVGLWQKNK